MHIHLIQSRVINQTLVTFIACRFLVLLAAGMSPAYSLGSELSFEELVSKQRELNAAMLERKIAEERKKNLDAAGSVAQGMGGKFGNLPSTPIDLAQPMEIDAVYGIGSALTVMVRTPAGLRAMRAGDVNADWRLYAISGNRAIFHYSKKLNNKIVTEQRILHLPGMGPLHRASHGGR